MTSPQLDKPPHDPRRTEAQAIAEVTLQRTRGERKRIIGNVRRHAEACRHNAVLIQNSEGNMHAEADAGRLLDLARDIEKVLDWASRVVNLHTGELTVSDSDGEAGG